MSDRFLVPAEMRALVLAGHGFENLSVRKVPVPEPGPRQLLARVDAAGICTSLLKLIDQGAKHSLLYGWNPEQFPLILGDEGAVTIMQVGMELANSYRVGQRCVLQPAVDHPPLRHFERYAGGGAGITKVAIGYTLPGHLAEYMLITEEAILAGCVIPLPDQSLAHAHAAISEPISCCISAQDHHMHLVQKGPLAPRSVVRGLKRGGGTVIIGAGAMGRMHIDVAMTYGPRAIVSIDLVPARLEKVRTLFLRSAPAGEKSLSTP